MNINYLIPDIYSFLGGEHGITDVLASDMGIDVSNAIKQSINPHERRGLRLSGLGSKCPRALWYSIHHPELAEPVPPYARIKFLYGHIIEHMVINLCKAAGHTVTGEQDELTVDGITGHRDCVIDGAVVDVKSTSSLGFKKFKDKTLAEDDGFGYLDQLDGYILGSQFDPLVTVKDRGYLLAVDKTLGHMCLYEHRLRETSIRERIKTHKEIVGRQHPPECACETETDPAGNVRLGVRASYSAFKHHCFPGLRTFLYAKGPVFFSKVMKTPAYKGMPLKELTIH